MNSTTKPLLLIGPGNTISNLKLDLFNTTTTLTFSGDLIWFQENNVTPNYFSFLDPYTLWWIYENYQKGLYSKKWLNKLKDSTTLLYNDLLFDGFYQKGLSTEFGEGWLLGEFKNKILPFIGSLFKEVIKIPTEVIYDEFTPNINLYSKHNILIHSNTNLNTDKFSTFIIPLSLHYFNPKEILSIGFGDYELPRYSATRSTSEYQGYKNSYNSIKEGLLNILQNLDINIKFLNPTSYYRGLEWKMEKITFCIPSKSNLRYLKTCIPSIRNNAHRNDHEIIIFVDSDEDGTVDWLEQVKDEYNLTYYVNPKLGKELYGIGRAYDFCINKSTTDIFMIFHADMILAPEADFEAYKYLKEKTVVCATRIEPPLHPNNGEKILEDFGMYPEDFNHERFLEYIEYGHYQPQRRPETTEGIFAPWMMYKKEYLEILGGHDPILHSCREDSDIFNRMSLSGFGFIQTWSGFVYHFTGRGAGSFDGDEQRHRFWQQQMNNSTRDFIRKWGSTVKHDALMKPIVPPKYDIGIIVKDCNDKLIEALEIWCSTMYVEENEDAIRKYYIVKEQPNTSFDLRDKIKPYDNEKNNEILVEVDGKNFSDGDYQYIVNLSEIIQDSGEIGEFELGNIKINIIQMNEYQNKLIKCQ